MEDINNRKNCIARNGIRVFVNKWADHKRPVLVVCVESENCMYKVASFNSEDTAQWFLDKMQVLFGGM